MASMLLTTLNICTIINIKCCNIVFREASLALHQLLELRDKADVKTVVPNGVHGYKTLYKCPVCSRSFRGNAYLRLHMRTHTGKDQSMHTHFYLNTNDNPRHTNI